MMDGMRRLGAVVVAVVVLLAGCGSGEDYLTVAKTVGLTEDDAQAVATLLCVGNYGEMNDVIWKAPGWDSRTDADRQAIAKRLLPLAAEEYCPDKRDSIAALLR